MFEIVEKTSWVIIYVDKEKRIIKNKGIGLWTADKTRDNREKIKELATKFEGKNWGFIADISELDTIVDPKVSIEFTKFHSEFHALGCIGVAFIQGSGIAIKVQSVKHQKESNAHELKIMYFKTHNEALNWFNSIGL